MALSPFVLKEDLTLFDDAIQQDYVSGPWRAELMINPAFISVALVNTTADPELLAFKGHLERDAKQVAWRCEPTPLFLTMALPDDLEDLAQVASDAPEAMRMVEKLIFDNLAEWSHFDRPSRT